MKELKVLLGNSRWPVQLRMNHMCVRDGMGWGEQDKVGKGLAGTGSQVSSKYTWMCVVYPFVSLFTIRSTLYRLSFLLSPMGRAELHGG